MNTSLSMKDETGKMNDELVLKIIEMRGKYRNLFTGRRNASRAGWRKIIHELDMVNLLTVERLKKKWSNLVQKYKEIRNSRSNNATEDGEELPVNWPFYEAMDELVGDHISLTQTKPSSPSLANQTLLSSALEKEYSSAAESPTASTSETAHAMCESPELPRVKRKKRDDTDPLLQIVQDTLRRLEEHHNHIEEQNDRLFNLLETFIANSSNN